MKTIIEDFEIENGQIEIIWFFPKDKKSTITAFSIDEDMILKVLADDVDFKLWSEYNDNGELLAQFDYASFDVFEYVITLLKNHLNKNKK